MSNDGRKKNENSPKCYEMLGTARKDTEMARQQKLGSNLRLANNKTNHYKKQEYQI